MNVLRVSQARHYFANSSGLGRTMLYIRSSQCRVEYIYMVCSTGLGSYSDHGSQKHMSHASRVQLGFEGKGRDDDDDGDRPGLQERLGGNQLAVDNPLCGNHS